MTLISAPAGFGETTLVSEWVYQKNEGRRMKDEGSGLCCAIICPPTGLTFQPLEGLEFE
jgi:hypothetical protein